MSKDNPQVGDVWKYNGIDGIILRIQHYDDGVDYVSSVAINTLGYVYEISLSSDYIMKNYTYIGRTINPLSTIFETE